MEKWKEVVNELNESQTKCILDCKETKLYLIILIANNNNLKLRTKIYVPKQRKYAQMKKDYIKATLEEYIMYYGGK